MRYLCLIYHDAGRLASLPEPAYAAFLGEVSEYGETLRKGGYHVAASFLQPEEAATTVRVRNGTTTITDGPAATRACSGRASQLPAPNQPLPFAENRYPGESGQPSQPGQLGGFYLIDARDLNDAIRLVARMPPARFGSVEIRPVRDTGCETRRFSTIPIDNG